MQSWPNLHKNFQTEMKRQVFNMMLKDWGRCYEWTVYILC